MALFSSPIRKAVMAHVESVIADAELTYASNRAVLEDTHDAEFADMQARHEKEHDSLLESHVGNVFAKLGAHRA